MLDEERRPLLPSQQNNVADVHSVEESLAELSENLGPPPPYSEYSYNAGSTSDLVLTDVCCEICHASLDMEGRFNMRVVKCHACGEATAISPPPPMKRYVRCPCNCLLVCKVTSQRIICPRQSCKRVIDLLPSTGNINSFCIYPDRSAVTIICAYCGCASAGSPSAKVFYQCFNCQKKSYTSATFKKSFLSNLILIGIITFFLLLTVTLLLFFSGLITLVIILSSFLILFTSIFSCKLFVFSKLKISQVGQF